MAEIAADPAQTPEDDRRAQQCAQKWIAELGVSEKAQRPYLERAKKIVRLYKRQDTQGSDASSEGEAAKKRFAMLWANTETLKPVVYARPPEPVVSRRYDATDAVGRTVSQVLEQALSTSIDLQDLDGRLKEARDDYVLIGRGQSWERYVPTHGPEVTPEIALQVVGEGPDDTAYKDPDGNDYDGEVKFREDGTAYGLGEPYKPVVFEESITDYVNWEDFGHSIARTWSEVWYVWRRVYLTRQEMIERFGAIGKVVPLDWGPVQQGPRDISADLSRKAAVYEIWDKSCKKVYWISKAWTSRPLDERDDPLGLDGFYPCPRPLLATTANDTVIPTPDYVYYQGQASEIDKLTGRISELQDALKVRGFYAGSEKTNLNQLFNAPNNTLISVPEWLGLKETGGARGMVEYWPIDLVVNALKALIEQRQQLVNDVYQITGIGDVLRGMNDPRATATAERIKGAWGTLRVRDKQKEMIRFARDVLRIKAGVISGKFDVETLKAISGVQLPTEAEKQALQAQVQQGAQQYQMIAQQAQAVGQQPPPPPEIPEEMKQALASPTWEQVIGLLRDNAQRKFRIDVETDSTVEPDEAEEKANAAELVGAIGAFITAWGPQVQANPALAPLAAAVLKFAIRRFRAGRDLEAVIEQTMGQLMAPGANAQQAEAPDTTPLQVAQINLQREQIKQQGENQRAGMQAQVEQGQQALEARQQQLEVIIGGRDPQPQVSV
jgi:hypothetical protein